MSATARSRNFRRRADEDNDNQPDAVSTPSNTKSSFSSSLSKPKKLLSFADEEEEQQETEKTLKTKPRLSSKTKPIHSRSTKLTSSHKLTASKDRLPHNLASTTSNVLPQAGVYTKEALLELQKNTRTLAKPSVAAAGASGSEARIILKGLLKANVEENSKEVESEDEGAPDEEMIRKIRAKREQMRQARRGGTPGDYISLEGGSGLGGAVGSIGEALSDDEEEEPEFRTRVAMIGNKEKGGQGVFEGVVDDGEGVGRSLVEGRNSGGGIGIGVEEDEEDKIWEEEQFRKGLGKRIDEGSGVNRVVSGSGGGLGGLVISSQHLQQSSVMSSLGPSIGGAFGGSHGLDALSISQQADICMKAFRDSVKKSKESHDKMMTSLAKTDENLSASLMNITSLEKALSAAGEKFIFMQKLRDFVSVLCEFLQHKAPYIEELEEQIQELQEQRASAILERRTADDKDEMMEVDAAVKAAEKVFVERGNSAAMIAAATTAGEAASAAIKGQSDLPMELDEFGRDINQQKRMDKKRRAEERQRRRDRHDLKKLSSMDIDVLGGKIEGESSTDESDSETAAYESQRELLLRAADQMFSDASEEYAQLSMVKGTFERWKKEYSASYRDAYMALSAPAIFSPYVRLELLKWDPLHKNADFADMKWHTFLLNYGLPDDGGDLNPDDADGNLVPVLVEKVALPILHHEMTHCWDVLSARETKNAVFATNLVIDYVPPSSDALAELLVAIRTRLAAVVSDLTVPTWSPLVLKAVPSAARVSAYKFGKSVRLMKNICSWREVLASPILEKLALDELLFRKILPHIKAIASNIHDAVTRTERVVASLSGVWAGPNVSGDHSRKLRPLVDLVLSLGRTMEKKHISGVPETETSGLARRLKKMLVDLNDYDNARQVARTFRLKEAL